MCARAGWSLYVWRNIRLAELWDRPHRCAFSTPFLHALHALAFHHPHPQLQPDEPPPPLLAGMALPAMNNLVARNIHPSRRATALGNVFTGFHTGGLAASQPATQPCINSSLVAPCCISAPVGPRHAAAAATLTCCTAVSWPDLSLR